MKNLLLCVIILLLNIITQAQTTQVEIIDLAVNPGIRADMQSDTTDLIVLFKINNVNLATKAYYYFGTVQDAGDVLSVTGNIIEQSGTYYLQVNGVQKEILGYTATVFIKLSGQQNAGFNYLTVFVEDNNGLITDKLYFHK
ncbi:MAG: hypothetical protein A2X08_08590 [Bacteroidetes bacterium GWA2_32_17]|nr:MAG: hypothetical protein A2X08_08590 [Bacteroidetes bacterium GWA2_32_17]